VAVRKSSHNKSVARNRCIPLEKTLRCSPVEFCVQVNSTLIFYYFLISICLWYKLNTLQMVSSRKKGKTIHSEAREMISHVNHQCKQNAVEKSLILPTCRGGERTADFCGVSAATVKQIR
jgi:hypothetical protein